MLLTIEQFDDTVQVSGEGVTLTYERHTEYPNTTARQILADIRNEVAEHAEAFDAHDIAFDASEVDDNG